MLINEIKTRKYLQIARELRSEIETQYVPGDHLPTERELQFRFSVTVKTIRNALVFLEQEGLVRRLPRRGTVVTARHANKPHDRVSNPVVNAGGFVSVNEDRQTIALVMPMEPYLISALAPRAERELRWYGYRLQLSGTYTMASVDGDHERAQAY